MNSGLNLQINTKIKNFLYEDEEVEIETGFIELEEEQESEDIEWVWEEEIEPEVDGPIGPLIIKKGRYIEVK